MTQFFLFVLYFALHESFGQSKDPPLGTGKNFSMKNLNVYSSVRQIWVDKLKVLVAFFFFRRFA